MKKIILGIVAAMAVINVHAGACAPVVKDTAWVYHWKFTGKTTTGKSSNVVVSKCSPGESCAIRVPSSLKIQGYTYACSPSSCADDSLGFETAFAEVNEVFWMTKPYKSSFAGGVTTEIAHIIGASKKKAEVGGVASFTDDNGIKYTFNYAGLGKYSTANARLTSASGNFAGQASQSILVNKNLCSAANAGFWSCDTLSLVCEAPTVVFGKWSVKYEGDKSKKFIKGIAPKLPSWVSLKNQE